MDDEDGAPTFASTPTRQLDIAANGKDGDDDSRRISDGSYWGFGLHRDGSLFGKCFYWIPWAAHIQSQISGIGYQIRRLVLKDGSVLYCIWVVRDPEALISHNLTRFGATNGFGKDKSDSSMENALVSACVSKLLGVIVPVALL